MQLTGIMGKFFSIVRVGDALFTNECYMVIV